MGKQVSFLGPIHMQHLAEQKIPNLSNQNRCATPIEAVETITVDHRNACYGKPTRRLAA